MQKKHPHIVYRYQNGRPADGECGNSGLHEWALRRFSPESLEDNQPQTGGQEALRPKRDTNTEAKMFNKRDVSLSEKYIELGLILSKDVFDKRNSSSRLEVLHDAVQIINCLDLYFRSANTRVSIVYIETWAHGDQIEINTDVKQTLYNLLQYTTTRLYKIDVDALHLLTGGHSVRYDAQKVGISTPGTICTSKAISLSQEASVFEPFVAASSMAHMLGHNLGMEHDEDVSTSSSSLLQTSQLPQASPAVEGPPQALPVQQAPLPGPPPPASFAAPFNQNKLTHQPGRRLLDASSAQSIEMDNNDHEDEIKSRSIAPGEQQDQKGSSSVVCQSNCLMSEHFVYLEPPVSFGNIIQINSTIVKDDEAQQPRHGSSSSQQNTFAIQQDHSSSSSSEQTTGGHEDDQTTSIFDMDLTEGQVLQAGLPFRFSKQSVQAYIRILRSGRGLCLFNKPNRLEDFKKCGNGIVDEGEECDCGKLRECQDNDSCCDPLTCRFKVEAQCTSGACCDRCKFRPKGFVCRRSRGECDLQEHCTGTSNHCPPDVYKQNGYPCSSGEGYCFLGQCPSHDGQCAELWGSEARNSDRICYSSFNLNGTRRGNCGLLHDANPPKFKRCEHQNMMCGTLQCQLGNMEPVTAETSPSMGATSTSTSMGHEYSNKTLYASDGRSHNCKVIVSGISPQMQAQPQSSSHQDNNSKPSGSISYVRDGSKCANNKVCFNKTCQPLESVYREAYDLCPRDELGRFCSNNGICSTANRCHCNDGWLGHDCSQPAPVESPVLPPSTENRAYVPNPVLGEPANHQQGLQRQQVSLETTSNNVMQQMQQQQQTNAYLVPVASGQGSQSGQSMSLETSKVVASVQPPNAASTAPPEPATSTNTSVADNGTTASPVAAAANSTAQTTTSNIQVVDKKKHDALGAPALAFILVSIVAAVYLGFALMANCYRRKGLIKPDKVLRHHQMNCKLDALRSSLIAKRLAGADTGALATAFDGIDGAGGSVPGLDVSSNGALLGDMMSPFVSPMSGQSSGQTGPSNCQHAGMFGAPNQIQQTLDPMAFTALPDDQMAAKSFFGGQSYGPNPAMNRPHQQQQQQIQANVHYFGQPDQCLHGPTMTGSCQQAQKQPVDTFSYPETGSGDHIPLLLGEHDQTAKRRTLNQQRALGNPQRSSFVSYGRPLASGVSNRAGQLQYQNGASTRPAARSYLPGHLASSNQQMNRAISLGSVSHRHMSNERLNYRYDEDDDNQGDEAARHASAVRRALATPSKMSGRQSMSIDRRAMHAEPLEDSCSVPSSPEHKGPYWSDAESRKRSLGGRGPYDGYHEDVLLGALPQPPAEYRASRRNMSGMKRSALRHQRSLDQAELPGGQLADDEDTLPPAPPPPAPSISAGIEPVEEIRQTDEEDDDETRQLKSHRRSNFQAKRNLDSLKLLEHRRNNNSSQFSGPQQFNPDNLSLIAQLQQLEQMQSLHQRELAREQKKSDVGLHEFFLLPLSVQLSALLARNLAGESAMIGSQQVSPIDEYLNTLNSTNVAKSSRQPAGSSSSQGPQHYPNQTSNPSRGNTISRQQAKLQNLQGLINRLQKLHQQTALQQQLEELNGMTGNFKDHDVFDQPQANSRHSTLGRKSGASQHRNQTNDDLFEVKSRQMEYRSRRASARQRVVSRAGQATGGGGGEEGRCGSKNESVYSMSDSEDGAYMSQVLNSYGQPTRTRLRSPSFPAPPNATGNSMQRHEQKPSGASQQELADRQEPNTAQHYNNRPTESTTPTTSTDVSSHLDHSQHPLAASPPPPPPPPPDDVDGDGDQH